MKNKINIVLTVLLVIVVASTVYFYKKSNPQSNAVASQEEALELVAKVGKLIILPEGEVPTIATVSDVEKLKDQPFFAKAKNGDKVLLYSNAKKAYLYDPVANKVLEVAPINLGPESAPAPAPAPASSTEEEDVSSDDSQ